MGISTKWLRELAQRGVLPRVNGHYPWPAVRQAFNVYLECKGEERRAPHQLKEERAALIRVQRESAELELSKRRGTLVDVGLFKEMLADMAARLDGKLRSVPLKWGPDLLCIEELPEMVRRLDDVVEELRAELRTAADE